MNPFAKLDKFSLNYNDIHELKSKLNEFMKNDKYSVVVCPLTNKFFEVAFEINDVSRQLGLPFYALNSSGLQGFFFADLGTENFNFQHVKKSKEDDKADEQLLSSKDGSITLRQYVDSFIKDDKKLSWKKREVMKPHKLVLLCFAAQALLAKSKSSENTHDTVLAFVKTKQGLSQYAGTYEASEVFKEITRKFETCWKNQIEFNPTSGVISAITSQEIIKVITRKDFPEHGFFIYDADTQQMVIEKI